MNTDKKTIMDELVYILYGYYPNKAGQAFEIISAVVFKILSGNDVKYDQYKRGEYSKTIYQLDGEISSDNEKIMLEAKDNSLKEKKVGRPDLQKLTGALADLENDKGIITSTTDYTKPAVKYAESTKINPNMKNIDLYIIKPSTEFDEKGRIKQIIINMNVAIPHFEEGAYNPELTKESKEKLIEKYSDKGNIEEKITEIYDKNKNIKFTIQEFSRDNQPDHKEFEDEFAVGAWDMQDCFIKIKDEIYEIINMGYKIPYLRSKMEFVLKSDEKPIILIKSLDGKVDKLLTEEEFKRLSVSNKEVK